MLSLVRKLREGVTSSGRSDAFAIEVYELSSDACILSDNMNEFLKGMTQLVSVHYPTYAAQHAGVEPAADAGSDRAPAGRVDALTQEVACLNVGAAVADVSGAGARSAELDESGPLARWAEFLGYFILYYGCFAVQASASSSVLEVSTLLRSMTRKQRASADVVFALHAVRAVSTSNYCAFFKLRQRASSSQRYFLDLVADRVRRAAVATMRKAYMQLPLSFVCEQLGFVIPGGDGAEAAASKEQYDVPACVHTLVDVCELPARWVQESSGIVRFREPK